MPAKKETIETVYFGPDGFGSLKQITKDDTITYEAVRDWESKQSFGQKYIHTYIHTYVHTYIHTYIHTFEDHAI